MGHALQIALIGFSVLLAVLPSHAQHRVALVVGNSTSSSMVPPTAPGPGSGRLHGASGLLHRAAAPLGTAGVPLIDAEILFKDSGPPLPTLQLSQNKPPVPSADLLIDDVPLPRNVSVSNPQDVPENFKRFSGAWVGAWGSRLHHVLIVESIMADGTANIVYAVGDAPAANIRRQWYRTVATIVANTLRAANVTYELTGNGQLDATFGVGYRRSRATMSSIELAELTRPGGTISWWPPVDLLVQDVPLPRSVSVSNPQDVPENFKRFSGAWIGAWGVLHHILIVESIMADGTANIVYAVGDNPAANVQRQWQRRVATIVGNTLSARIGNTLSAASATYELTGNGQLDATFESRNGRSRATMSSIELAELTRLGVTISQNKLTPPAPTAALPPRPLVARAQQPEMPVVGFLDLRSPSPDSVELAAFRQGLAAAGFDEGRNVAVEYRWANNQPWLLAPLAAELVQRQVAVIVALDSHPTIFAASNATSTIPIVFLEAEDPTMWSRVGSLNRPSGNMTGVALLSSDLTGKRLGILREMAPLATTIAYLTDPRELNSEAMRKDMLAAARTLGRQALILEARNQLDIDAAFTTLVKSGAGALAVSHHLLFTTYNL
jgi:hypothetical protein